MQDISRTVTIAALHHDLVRKQSVVRLVWTGDPEKSVALPVAFGCSLDALPAEAERALRALSTEIASIPILSA
jgi:hypothetical protein